MNIVVVYLLTYTLSLNSVFVRYTYYNQPPQNIGYHVQVDATLHLSRRCHLTMSLPTQYNGAEYCTHIPGLHKSHPIYHFLQIYRDRINSENTNSHTSAEISSAKNWNILKCYQKIKLPKSFSIEQRQLVLTGFILRQGYYQIRTLKSENEWRWLETTSELWATSV